MQDVRSTRARTEVLAEIFARIAAGESVRGVCSSGGDIPTAVTFWRWMLADESMRAAYDRATTDRAERFAEEIAEIADEQPPTVEILNREGEVLEVKLDAGFVAWQRNRIDARKWTASRLLPKRYGDRTIVSGDPDNPVEVRHSVAGRLLPELASRDSNGALVGIDGGRAGSARVRVGILGATGSTDAAGTMDVLAEQSGPGLGKNANGR